MAYCRRTIIDYSVISVCLSIQLFHAHVCHIDTYWFIVLPVCLYCAYHKIMYDLIDNVIAVKILWEATEQMIPIEREPIMGLDSWFDISDEGNPHLCPSGVVRHIWNAGSHRNEPSPFDEQHQLDTDWFSGQGKRPS